jgi:hypothetical protein
MGHLYNTDFFIEKMGELVLIYKKGCGLFQPLTEFAETQSC